jgi:hypothetical protein
MSDVLIRDVPADDLDQIRSAAAEKGTSVQNYLRDAVHAQAAYLRRQAALTRTAERLGGRPAVPAEERNVALDAIEDAHIKRADQLSDRPTP